MMRTVKRKLITRLQKLLSSLRTVSVDITISGGVVFAEAIDGCGVVDATADGVSGSQIP